MIILILTNHQLGLYKFRRELLERLLQEKHEVYVSVPPAEYTEELRQLGVEVIDNNFLDRRGTDPIRDLRLIKHYKSLVKIIRPDVVLTYTIKPNVYGGYVCGRLDVPYIANVTGLGTSIQNGGLLQKVTQTLYRKGLKKARKVFFQNSANRDYMLEHHIVSEDTTDVLPGSGVNTEQNCYEPYPMDGDHVIITTIGRIMKDKGIDEILEAARIIKQSHPNTEFRLIGDFDEGYEETIREADKQGIIKYLGFQKDVHRYIAESHAILHASYHEGMSNVLLEAASTGRPVIATNVPGCRETYEPGVTGIGFEAKNTESLVAAIETFLQLTPEQRMQMGKAGREKMVREFDRKIICDRYTEAIEAK